MRRTLQSAAPHDEPRPVEVVGWDSPELMQQFAVSWPPPQGFFLAAYGPFRHLGTRSAEQERFEADPVLRRVSSLFVESSSLSEGIEWLQRVHTRALEKKPGARQLKRDVLRLLNAGLLPDGSRVVDVDSDGLWVERGGVRLLLTAMSDGYRTVTALVLDLVRHLHDCFGELALEERDTWSCPHPGVVLIDEIDAHLHVSWQQRLGFWLRERFPRLQFIVTTHSPFICQAASPRGIIRLPAPGEARSIEHVSEEVFKAVVNGSADDAVLSELFGMEHAHSEKVEAMRQRLAALQLKQLRRQPLTPAELDELSSLSEALPDSMGHAADQALRAIEEARHAED